MTANALFSICTMTLLTACGGGGGSQAAAPIGNTPPQDATLNLAITDAPVDSAQSVIVEFSGVSIKPNDGDELTFQFESAKSIDLLALQGSNAAPLLENQTVAPGNYEWIRLAVNAENGIRDSYMITSDGSELELRIPSGSETGLKLVSGFTMAEGGTADFTIDFDIRKSITNPPGQAGTAILKPALRLVNNLEVGTITGTISAEIIANACGQPDVFAGAVYLYSGENIRATDLGHMDENETLVEPFTTALTRFGDDGNGNTTYRYEFGFLPAGTYSIAYTCSDDDPQADERQRYATEVLEPEAQEGESIVVFYGAENTSIDVAVEAGATTTQNFELSSS